MLNHDTINITESSKKKSEKLARWLITNFVYEEGLMQLKGVCLGEWYMESVRINVSELKKLFSWSGDGGGGPRGGELSRSDSTIVNRE